MAFNEQAEKYRFLDEWFMTPQGSRVGQAMSAELAEVQAHLKGNTLVQLGHCGANPWLKDFAFSKKWVINPSKTTHNPALISALNGLPFDRDSIDCILAPLTLEAFIKDKSPLDEMDRVLKPMGYLIFLGINPWSFWGLSHRLGWLRCFGKKSAGSLTSSFSLKRAMASRGYHQCLHSSFYYTPPFTNKKLIESFEFFNEVGKMVRPFPAGFYCLVMQKYQYGFPSLITTLAADEEILVSGRQTWPAAGNMRR